MEAFETVATFTLPSEVVVAKSRLESEGIKCIVLNELTIQSYNFISNAIGGVKLQVLKSEYKRAYKILLEGGFIIEEENKLSFIERKLNEPLFLKRFKTILLSFFIICAFYIIAIIVFSFITRQSNYDRLIGEEWCLDHIVYNGQMLYPNTVSDEIKFLYSGRCNEIIEFHPNGYTNLPGFDTKSISGSWILEDEKIILSNIDTLKLIFEGVFDITSSKKELTLTSKNTQIFCIRKIYY